MYRTEDENDEEVNDHGLEYLDDNNFLDECNYEIESNIEITQETEEFVKWARPKIVEINSNEYPLIFQQFEIDHYVSIENPKTVFRLYGVNKAGNSIMAHVNGFCPYLYTKPPPTFVKEDCDLFREILNKNLKTKAQQHKNIIDLVLNVEYVLKADIYGFSNHMKVPFLKITLRLHELISVCKRVLQEGIDIPKHGFHNLRSYDCDIDFLVRFMVDSGLVGCGWVEFPPGSYSVRRGAAKSSLCQLEVDTDWSEIIFHSPDMNWSDVAPIRILSLNIECAGRNGCFPEPSRDPVIQISNMVTRFGETEPFMTTIFTLGSCAPVVGASVIAHDTEVELLTHWAQFIRAVDPDIVTGYDIQNFDLPFLIDRARALKVEGVSLLGRVKSVPSRVTTRRVGSKQMGHRNNKMVHMTGRVQFDLLLVLYRDYKLRCYSLNAVSFHFLEEQKEEFGHQIITDLQSGDQLSRRRLATYCIKEAHLVLRLLGKLMCVLNYIEMARVTGVPFSYLISRGQQVKVLAQLLRKTATEDFLLPTYQSRSDGDEFTGGIVIDPKKGLYSEPIATLDFASLYPSIMMAHNLCYTTLVRDDDVVRRFGLASTDYITTPCQSRFVSASVKRGLLPAILMELIDARKMVKRDLATETDPFKKQVLDGRQLALKTTANSVYGFTGAQQGRLPCLDICSSVTAFGRQMIEATKEMVEKTFTKTNGYHSDAEVIYGDTDSVMCRFGVATVPEAMALGKEAANLISRQFIAPIKLEFEKVYFPYLLISKKKYAGMHYTKPDVFDKMDCKGLETVRRDNCPLVANLINTCLQKLLINRDKNAALAHAKSVIADLLCDRVDISQLIITKELSKTSEKYTAKQAHCELAMKMRKRDPGSAPKLGDRVPYVITNLGVKNKLYTRSEDPIYVLDNNIPIDTEYYLKNQLTNPLMRLFEPIFGKEFTTKNLLFGDHVLTKAKPKSNFSEFSKFTYVRPKCIGCKNLLKEDQKSLCDYCKSNAHKIYYKEIVHLKSLEDRFCRLWTECQRCSGVLHQEVLCTSRDCPIFYMRRKSQKDVISQSEVIDKLEKDLTW